MRKTRNVVAAVALLGLLTSACGGSATPATDTAETVASTTSEPARERNVEVAGWGADGSGVATTRLSYLANSSADVRVFRRTRIDTSGSMRVVSTQDAFVTVLTHAAKGNIQDDTLTVHGFVTRDGGVNDYTMSGFGNGGIATIKLAAKPKPWITMPVSWTVVSRETVALLFVNSDPASNTVGSIEFLNIATGQADSRFGRSGRIEIDRKSYGVNSLLDVTLRRVEDNGAPHLVLLAADNLDDGFTHDLFAIGLNPDGTRDTEVGKNGLVSVQSVLGDNTFAAGYQARLADPGIDNTGKALAVATSVTFIDFDTTDGQQPASQSGFLYAKLPGDVPGNIAVSVGAAPSGFPMLLNVVLDPTSARFAVLTSDPEAGLMRQIATRDGATLAIASQPQANNMKGLAVGPFSVSTSLISGTWFGAQLTPHQTDGNVGGSDVVVCFDERHCAEGETAVTRPASTFALEGFGFLSPSSVLADANGVHVAVRDVFSGQVGIASLSSTGQPTSTAGVTLVDGFPAPRPGSGDPAVGLPVLADAATLIANSAPSFAGGADSIVTKTNGANAKKLAIQPALGSSGYTWTYDEAAVVDQSSIIERSMINGDNNRLATKLHRVSIDNGSVMPFGPDGAITVQPLEVPPDDQCWSMGKLVASPGVAAFVQYLMMQTTEKPVLGPPCLPVPRRLAWTSVRPDGTSITARVDATTFDPTEGVREFIPTKSGALYVLTMALVATNTTMMFAPVLRVRKYLPSGTLDATYGTNGLATIDSAIDDIAVGFNEPRATIDNAGNIYIAAVRPEGDSQVAAVIRLTATGQVDRAPGKKAHAPVDGNARVTREEVLRRRAELIAMRVATTNAEAVTEASATPIVTVTGDAPVLLSVRAVEDRSLTATWGLSPAVGDVYVTATASPGGRSCTARETSCVIRGLDPAEAYKVVVSKKGTPVPDAATSNQPATKPVRVLRPGQVASPSSIVKPASRGKATWRVSGKCTLNDTFTKFTTPRLVGRCRLAVTNAKDGTIPKTTRSVTIVVKK